MSAPGNAGVARLREQAGRAREVRALTMSPDVIALRVERVRAQVDALLWTGIILGLAFTMVNVQAFAAAGTPKWGLAWWSAWLLDPMVSLVLLAILRAEQVTARWQVSMGPWARRTKWLTFAATYVMNTWSSWDKGDTAGVVLHSVPPLLVFFASETGPGLRDKLTEAVARAATTPTDTVDEAAPVPHPGAAPVPGSGEPDPDTLTDPSPVDPSETTAPVPGNTEPEPVPNGVRRLGTAPTRRTPTRLRNTTRSTKRRFFADYLTEATRHHTPGQTVSPAWVREHVPGIGRATSSRVAAALNTRPDTEQPAVADITPTNTTATEIRQEAA